MLGTALSLAACAPDVQTPSEASQRVRDSYAWMADAELCPADLMRADMRVNGLREASCANSELATCLQRCRKGDVDACYWLAHTLEQADPQDPAAQALYQRACSLGEPSGCTNRAASLFLGKTKDAGIRTCAARTFAKTCELDDRWGCTMLGNALHEGLGVEQDDDGALRALERGCDEEGGDDFPACRAARDLRDRILRSRADATASGAPREP